MLVATKVSYPYTQTVFIRVQGEMRDTLSPSRERGRVRVQTFINQFPPHSVSLPGGERTSFTASSCYSTTAWFAGVTRSLGCLWLVTVSILTSKAVEKTSRSDRPHRRAFHHLLSSPMAPIIIGKRFALDKASKSRTNHQRLHENFVVLWNF